MNEWYVVWYTIQGISRSTEKYSNTTFACLVLAGSLAGAVEQVPDLEEPFSDYWIDYHRRVTGARRLEEVLGVQCVAFREEMVA